MNPPRGRPRKYDPQVALNAAARVFTMHGYSGTSLDQLAEAMGMNRPSIYNAFGDKEAIYRRALAQYCQHLDAGFEQTVLAETDIRKGIILFYDQALAAYFTDGAPLGCMVMCTAPAAAFTRPEVRADLNRVLKSIDTKLRGRLAAAVDAGQIAEDVDAGNLAKLMQAVLHSLALRARGGESRESLKRMARYAVKALLPIPNAN